MQNGGLLQLAAQGSQDKFLTYNPEISYFKSVFKSHTNFAIESIRVDFERNTNIFQTQGNKLKVKIPRFGDLLSKSYLVIRIPNVYCNNSLEFKWLEGLGEHIMEMIQITIGGQIIDQQYGQQIHIQNQLETSQEKIKMHNILTGNTVDMYDPETSNGGIYPFQTLGGSSPSIRGRLLYIPLPFWFSREYGKSLPLVSLLYHDVELTIEIPTLDKLYLLQYTKNSTLGHYFPNSGTSTHTINNFVLPNELIDNGSGLSLEAYLECEYIFLEESERKYIAQNPQDYLVETHFRQSFGELLNTGIIEPKVSNLLKHFFIIIRDINTEPIPTNRQQVLTNGAILLNGLERVSDKPGEFYELVQPYNLFNNYLPGVYCFSFSIAPMNRRQPAGYINVSRIQNFQFRYNLSNTNTTYEIIFYSEGYNFLRIISGMGALAFAG